jgi:hypothetical protein
VAKKSGDVRECACASPRLARRGAELTGQAHDAERERKGAHRATTRRLAIRVRETKREREHAGEQNQRRQVGPSGQRARERARTGESCLEGGE